MENIINSEIKLMSSKQIAERTGKQHNNVIRDIRNMIEELIKSQNSNLSSDEYTEIVAQNKMTAEFMLNERLCLCLASGYSVVLRMMIIDDWAKLKQPKELSRKEMLILALQAEEEKEKLQTQIKQLAPKAEYLDIVLKSVDSLTTTSIASEFGMTAQKINKELISRGIQRKIDKHYVLTAKYVNKGYADNRTYSYQNGKGEIHTSQLLVWTEYGKAFLHSLFNTNLSFSKAYSPQLNQSNFPTINA